MRRGLGLGLAWKLHGVADRYCEREDDCGAMPQGLRVERRGGVDGPTSGMSESTLHFAPKGYPLKGGRTKMLP